MAELHYLSTVKFYDIPVLKRLSESIYVDIGGSEYQNFIYPVSKRDEVWDMIIEEGAKEIGLYWEHDKYPEKFTADELADLKAQAAEIEKENEKNYYNPFTVDGQLFQARRVN